MVPQPSVPVVVVFSRERTTADFLKRALDSAGFAAFTAPTALDRLIAQRLGFGAVLAAEAGLSDVMLGWDVPLDVGAATRDKSVRVVPLVAMLAETARLLDGSSPVVRRRVELLNTVEDILAF